METKRGRGGPKGPRPHIWKTGAYDEDRHKMFTPWMVSKAQANFRREEWNLEFEEYYQIWKDHWHNRGRKAENVCMTRMDTDSPWAVDNVTIMSRKEHLKILGERRTPGTMFYNMKNRGTR